MGAGSQPSVPSDPLLGGKVKRKILTHGGREIEDNGIDYGDGSVMIRYKDDGDVVIVPKLDIKVEEVEVE